jgi:ATP-dependent Clp protease ATP-binding subunit ClpA
MVAFLVGLIKTYTYSVPRKLLLICYRSFFLLDNEIGVRLNLALLFTPLFGDLTITGKIIGFVYRLLLIIFGGILLLFLEIFLFGLFISYFYLFYHFYALGFTAFEIFLVSLIFVYGVRFFSFPIRYFSNYKKSDPLDYLVDPNSRKLLNILLTGKAIENPQVLENYSNISYLLAKFDFSLLELIKFIIQKVGFTVSKEDLLKKAYGKGIKTGATYIGEELLFCSYLELLPGWTVFLSEKKKNEDWLDGTLSFVYFSKKRKKPQFFWDDDFKVPFMGGVNRGLTGRVTPILNQYSTDITHLASRAYLAEPVGRDAKIEEVIAILGRPLKNSVLLIGEPGSGKTSFINAIAYRIVQGTSHKSLRFKRVVSLEPGAFFGGGNQANAVAEKFLNVLAEVRLSGGIIGFIDEIHTLAAVGVDSPEGSPIFGILEPKLSSGEVQLIATTTYANYEKYIAPNQSFSRVFERVDIPEATINETRKILEINGFDTERRTGVIVSYPAIDSAISLSKTLIYSRVFPDKAVNVLEKAISTGIRNKVVVVGADLVASAVSDISRIPIPQTHGFARDRLLDLEFLIEKKIIGQKEAVVAVADSIRRELTGARNTSKPIASFLFLGPTGVGKTELAKVSATCFFGKSPKLIRYNLNQYITPDRLVYFTDSLCSEVAENPFSLVLLDEIEKGHSEILLSLLQILDEGVLLDSKGKEVRFNNVFFVATSNIGSYEISTVLSKNGSYEDMKEKAINALKRTLVPELINRFSDVVVFGPLTTSDFKDIVRIRLGLLRNQLLSQKITVNFDDSLVNKLALLSFSAEYGAREVDRIIKDKIESRLAKMIISGRLKPGVVASIDSSIFNSP